MINKKIFLYGSIFVLVGGVGATAGYLLGPSKTVDGVLNANDGGDDKEGGFVPVELSPSAKFISSLSEMKTLDGEASISLSYGEYNFDLTINELNLTLETLDNVNAYVDATLKYNDVISPINVTYVDNTVYASLLGINAKFEVSEFTKITDLLDYFNVEISLPEQFQNIDMNYLINKLGEMEYKENEDGYEYCLKIIDEAPIYFYSDKDYNFKALKADISFEGLSLKLDAALNSGFTYTEENKINAPLDKDLYNNVSNVIPLARHIGDLLNQKQFNLSLNGDIKLRDDYSISVNGSTQFDIEQKSGLAKLVINEHHKDGEFAHNIDLDISKDDVIFNYNDSLKGKLAFANVNDIINAIKVLMNNFETVDIENTLNSLMSKIDGTVIKDVIDGKYESLLNNVLKNVALNENSVSFSIDKSILGLDNDVDFEVLFNEEKISSLSIRNLSISSKVINLSLALNDYDENYKTSIDRNDSSSYSDYSNIVPLVKGLNALIAQEKRYAIGFEGSLTSSEKQYGLSFNGKARFDIENPDATKQSGDGEITIIENESKYDPKPSHNVKVAVNGTDALFEYNNSLHGKFTVQTLRDMFGVAFDLLEDQNSRIYQWFGEMIDNMNETIVMRIVNGEFELLFHNIIKEISLNNNEMNISLSGAIFNLDTDINIKIGFSEEKISSIELVGFNFDKYTVGLKANILDYGTSETVVADPNEVKYYDFSEIKTLLKLGINVANLDYFHITGNVSMTLKLGSVDLKGLANLKNLPIDLEVFENNGDITLRGTISNIPQQTIMNGGVNTQKKRVDFYYKDNYVYIERTDNVKTEWWHVGETKNYTKTTLDDFMNNILVYTLGFGLGMNYSSSIWSSIKGAMSEQKERTTPIDYSKILTNFLYTNGQNDYGEHRWDLGLNMAELTNNSDMKSCDISLFGKKSDFYDIDEKTNEQIYKDYLSHLTFGMFIDTGSFSVDIGANLDLVDVDPNITYNDFETNEKTSKGFKAIIDYANAHVDDKPLSI